MNTIGSILLLILILCIIIFIHELGHFLTAKKAGVYVYEFSLGFGPKIWGFRRKNDETEYCLRCIPLGGFVSMAGETNSQEDDKKTKGKRLVEKKFLPHMSVLLAGVVMNFILAIVLLFFSGWIYGSPETKAIIGEVTMDTPAYFAGFTKGDEIVGVNGNKINTLEDLSLTLATIKNKEEISFKLVSEDGFEREVKVKGEVIEKDGVKTYKYGFATSTTKQKGLWNAMKYSVNKFGSLMASMWDTLAYLFTGKVSVRELSGPIGMYSVVDSVKSTGLENILYLLAFLSVNVGVINLIPIPVFDGGRALLLIIEKIKGGKLPEKVETTLDLIGFGIMILLMLFVTVNDIFKLF